MMDLLTIHRRPVIDELKEMEPWLNLAENISIVSILVSLLVHYLKGDLWSADLVPIPTLLYYPLRGIQMALVPATKWYDYRSFKIHSYVLFVLVEHVALVLRSFVLPRFLEFTVGHRATAVEALRRLIEIRENAALRLLFWQNDDIKGGLARMMESNAAYVTWNAMLRLADIQSRVGISMNAYLWAALALVPFILQNHFHVSWYYSFLPIFLVCSYHQSKIDRKKRAIAMSMICDPAVFQFIQKELPGYLVDPDMQRCEWVSM